MDEKLHGESKKLGIRKGNNKVEFDIVINTSKIALFCTYLKKKKGISKDKSLLNVDENKSR